MCPGSCLRIGASHRNENTSLVVTQCLTTMASLREEKKFQSGLVHFFFFSSEIEHFMTEHVRWKRAAHYFPELIFDRSNVGLVRLLPVPNFHFHRTCADGQKLRLLMFIL